MSAELKGPWSLCYDGVIEDAEGGTVIGFPFDSYREFNEQSDFDKAKQRAIAAAPELLAALIALDEAFCSENRTREERRQSRLALIAARAAVTKATEAA